MSQCHGFDIQVFIGTELIQEHQRRRAIIIWQPLAVRYHLATPIKRFSCTQTIFSMKVESKKQGSEKTNVASSSIALPPVSYLSIWIDSKPIVWDSSVVFTDNFDLLALCLTRFLQKIAQFFGFSIFT